MRTKFNTSLQFFSALLLLLFIGMQLSAQGPHHVIVANGGVWGPTNQVTVGAYEILGGNYMEFDSFPASSVQDIIVHDEYAFLAADSFLVRYNLDTRQRTNIRTVHGVRKLAIYQDKLIVTRGFGATSDYVMAFNHLDLSPAFSIDSIPDLCEGVTVWGDTAYVAVPGAWGASSGSIAVIDLAGESLVRTVDLDSMGKEIGLLYNDGANVWSVNSIGFGNPTGVITQYTIATGAVMHHTVGHHLRGGAGIADGLLYCFMDDSLGTFNLNTGQVEDAGIVPAGSNPYAVARVDTVANRFYVTETDYATFGSLHMTDWNGSVMNTQAIGISPEAMALDAHLPLSQPEAQNANFGVKAWPNPLSGMLNVRLTDASQQADHWSISDLQGRELLGGAFTGASIRIDVKELPAGMYTLRLSGKGFTASRILMRSGN